MGLLAQLHPQCSLLLSSDSRLIVAQGAPNSIDPDWRVVPDGSAFDDPLLHCLVALTRMAERPATADSLRAGLPLVEGRLTPELFIRAAARSGLSARVVNRPLKKISNLVLPAVLLLHEQQACVALEIDVDHGKARLLLPETEAGEQTISLDMLERRYLGYTIFVRPEHRIDDRAPDAVNASSRHWFWGTLLQNWRIYRDVLVASFLINIFALALPFFILNVYDRVVPNNATETLWVLAIGVTTVAGFELLMRALRVYFIDNAGRKTDVELSASLFQKVLGIKLESRPLSVGAFANNLHEFETVRDFLTSTTITTVIDLPFAVLFLLVIWFLGGPIVLVPIACIPLILAYTLAIQWPLRRAVDNTFRASSQKNATLVESLTGLEAIRALGAEGQIQRTWEQAVGYIAKWGARARLLSTSVTNFSIFVQHVALIGVVVVGVYLIGDGRLSLGGLIACVILSRRGMSPMTQVANLATRYHQARAALVTLNKVMELPVERSEGKSFVSKPQLPGSIEFQNLSFTYPNQSIEALKDVSFQIKAGEHVAVVGRMGSGKTTLGKLILGLYEPTAGSVCVGGTDLRQLDPADLRRRIGYVAQDIMLFYGNVRENIVLGAADATDERVLQAAQTACVSEFVDRHPLGYDMPAGERGSGLSGGQRQSVAIARALLLDPPILLLDEPTNSMDSTTERRLIANMTSVLPGKTLVLITHKTSLLELIDRVIILDNGRVVADGPKGQVLEALNQGQVHSFKR